jgi:hypothetical protein
MADRYREGRSLLGPEQIKRFDKVFMDRIHLLDRKISARDGATFVVSGSVQCVYHVTLHPNSGRFACDCPDAMSHCKRHRCVCKHVCFVIVKVLGIQDVAPIISGVLHLDWDAMTLLADANSGEVTEAHLVSRYRQFVCTEGGGTVITKFSPKQTSKEDEDEEDEECPICYELLVINDTPPPSDSVDSVTESIQGLSVYNGRDHRKTLDLVACPDCKKNVHKVCIEQWMSYGNTSCVYCRSQSWDTYFSPTRNTKRNGYLVL